MVAGIPLMSESSTSGKTWTSVRARDMGSKSHSDLHGASGSTRANMTVACEMYIFCLGNAVQNRATMTWYDVKQYLTHRAGLFRRSLTGYEKRRSLSFLDLKYLLQFTSACWSLAHSILGSGYSPNRPIPRACSGSDCQSWTTLSRRQRGPADAAQSCMNDLKIGPTDERKELCFVNDKALGRLT